MLDLNKRRTIKLLGAAPLVSIPLLSVASSTAALDATNAESLLPKLPAAKPNYGMALQIQIVHSTSIPDNNVILRNTSDEQLIVSRFMPGHIYFDDHIIDLNEAVGKQSLILSPGQSKAFDFAYWPVINAGPTEYVWADHAMEKLNDETSIITLGAFMADTSAVVYANTKQYVSS